MALEPITRQEKIIAGQDLTPITRMEMFLKQFGGGGGSGLPTGGATYQQLVTDGEGKAKWEDRLCYYESGSETVIDTSLSWAIDPETHGYYVTNAIYFPFVPNDGESYKIIWGGTTFVVSCKKKTSSITYYDLSPDPNIMITVDESKKCDIFSAGGPVEKISIFRDTSKVKKIDEKFIPEMSYIILKSSTSGSEKQFKITVDDSGTISATEVT